ncbi:MAG TPA: hypothetical protein VGC39_00985 [Candidatus Methylacidiphilales bacterium]
MDTPNLNKPVTNTTISLNDVADRYLEHYQRLFDLSIFSLSSFRKANEQDYDEFAQQLIVMPKNTSRMTFDKAKDATETWVLKHILSEALSSVVPLMEDCRTICSLCDYKVSKKDNPTALQAITSKQRQEFLALPIVEKFDLLEKKYGLTSEVREHVQSLLEVTRALLTKDGVVTKEETGGKDELTLKIRSVTLVQGPAGPSAGGEQVLSLTRKIGDNNRTVKVGEKISFSKAEQFGSLVTLSIFLASMLQGVQTYARKVGAAS